jgi:modulator of FtsH protease HflC
MSKVSITLLLAALVVVILIIFPFMHEVGFYQAAVRVHLGQADASSVITEPGWKWRWPPPIDRVETYDVRLRTLDAAETETKTVDGKNVIVGVYAVWRIADPLRFYTSVRDVAKAETQLRSRLVTAQVAVIGQNSLTDFVNLDVTRKDASYQKLLDGMQANIAPGALRDYGVEIKRLGIRRISLPKETTQQIFEAMKQERNNLAAVYQQEGKSRAAGIRARAEANANTIEAFANRRAQEIESEGVKASTRILAMIPKDDVEFFEWLRWLDALKASLAQKTTIFLDQNSPLFKPFVNPPVELPAGAR